MPLHPDVERVAERVRAKVVRWVAGNPNIGNNLCGACAIASFALWRSLRAIGRQAKLVASIDDGYSAHCWVELSSHVVDITATQFGGPRIAIFKAGEIPDWAYEEVYVSGRKLVDAAAVKNIEQWDQQSPIVYKSKIDRLVRSVADDFSGTRMSSANSTKPQRRATNG